MCSSQPDSPAHANRMDDKIRGYIARSAKYVMAGNQCSVPQLVSKEVYFTRPPFVRNNCFLGCFPGFARFRAPITTLNSYSPCPDGTGFS